MYYHRSPLGNFGDDLNEWLWDDLLPGWRGWSTDRMLVGVGTLLSSDLERRLGEGRRFLVAGSGVGYGDGRAPDVSDRTRWDIRSVRGPASARMLGLPEPLGIIDPAAMIPRVAAFAGIERQGRPVFVPHESTVERHDWAAVCAAAGLDFVSPRGESRAVIRRLAGAPLVIAESMHAAIIADAFRTPWVPVRIGHRFLDSKWHDWADSLGLRLGPIPPLFASEDRLFAAARRSLQSRRRKGSGPADPSPAPKAPGRPPRIVRLQIAVEAPRVAGALRRHLKRPPMLSETAVLEAKRTAYAAMLDTIRRDYG